MEFTKINIKKLRLNLFFFIENRQEGNSLSLKEITAATRVHLANVSKNIQTILKSLKEQQKPEQEPDWIEGVSSQFCKLKQWIINSAI